MINVSFGFDRVKIQISVEIERVECLGNREGDEDPGGKDGLEGGGDGDYRQHINWFHYYRTIYFLNYIEC